MRVQLFILLLMTNVLVMAFALTRPVPVQAYYSPITRTQLEILPHGVVGFSNGEYIYIRMSMSEAKMWATLNPASTNFMEYAPAYHQRLIEHEAE